MKKEKQIEEIFNIIVDGVIDGDDNNGMPTGNTWQHSQTTPVLQMN